MNPTIYLFCNNQLFLKGITIKKKRYSLYLPIIYHFLYSVPSCRSLFWYYFSSALSTFFNISCSAILLAMNYDHFSFCENVLYFILDF